MKKGLVVGKFYPPHKGHHLLIDTALTETDHVDVLVCDRPQYTVSAKDRAAWLQIRHPAAQIQIIADIEKDEDSVAWADYTAKLLGYTPDVVFSSEDYGDEYARLMGASHHQVDKQRIRVPISGTQIRGDVLAYWDFMEPGTRANFALRICVLGAESTGTTTLVKALARHYCTNWVPEYGRYYSESLQYRNHKWQSGEFTFIAKHQQALENQLAGKSNGLLICDTNAFATRLWHERYMGTMSAEVDEIASRDRPDLYILTDVDIPFVQDGVRDGKHIRKSMNQRFIEELKSVKAHYLIVSGSRRQRLTKAKTAINSILTRKVVI